MLIDWATQVRLGDADTIRDRIATFRAALEAHAQTVDEAAPTEDPVIERAARADEVAFEAPPPAPGPAPRRMVEKGTITERIIAAGKLSAALTALGQLPIEDQQRWANKTAVYADDARARGLLERIGLDPDVILAP